MNFELLMIYEFLIYNKVKSDMYLTYNLWIIDKNGSNQFLFYQVMNYF